MAEEDRVLRRTILKASTVGMGMFLAGCTALTGEDDAQDASAPHLDLDTLQAETPDGTLQAEPWENTYVGAVDDDLYIGVSLSEGADTENPQEARVYLCDSEELSARGPAKLERTPRRLRATG